MYSVPEVVWAHLYQPCETDPPSLLPPSKVTRRCRTAQGRKRPSLLKRPLSQSLPPSFTPQGVRLCERSSCEPRETAATRPRHIPPFRLASGWQRNSMPQSGQGLACLVRSRLEPRRLSYRTRAPQVPPGSCLPATETRVAHPPTNCSKAETNRSASSSVVYGARPARTQPPFSFTPVRSPSRTA
jgi:hypothetical protein